MLEIESAIGLWRTGGAGKRQGVMWKENIREGETVRGESQCKGEKEYDKVSERHTWGFDVLPIWPWERVKK